MMTVVVVSTTCPFCQATGSLIREETDKSDTALVEELRGRRISCQHADCGQSYAIRREDVTIRRV
jgi:hypothetical protein